jgi:PAS domain-containing protein
LNTSDHFKTAQVPPEAAKYQALVEGIRDYAILMLDIDGHVISWNDGAEAIKGYTADEIIGSHFSRFYPPEALARDLLGTSSKWRPKSGASKMKAGGCATTGRHSGQTS